MCHATCLLAWPWRGQQGRPRQATLSCKLAGNKDLNLIVGRCVYAKICVDSFSRTEAKVQDMRELGGERSNEARMHGMHISHAVYMVRKEQVNVSSTQRMK